jgi:hypothetical protein
MEAAAYKRAQQPAISVASIPDSDVQDARDARVLKPPTEHEIREQDAQAAAVKVEAEQETAGPLEADGYPAGTNVPGFVSMNRASATKTKKRKARAVEAQSARTFEFAVAADSYKAGDPKTWVRAEGRTKSEAQASLKLKKNQKVVSTRALG